MRNRSILAATAATVLLSAAMALPATAQDAGPLRIGVQGPLSGPQGPIGEGILNGAQLAADTLNAADGVLGRQVELVPIDDAGDLATGVTAATAAIASGLDGLVGPYNSGIGLEVLPLYEPAGIVPMRLTSHPGTSGHGYALKPMMRQIEPVTVQAITDWREARSVVILVDETQPWSVEFVAGLTPALETAGVTVLGTLPVEPGGTDYTSLVAEAAALAPDLLYVATYAPEGAAIAQAVHAAAPSSSCLMDLAVYSTAYVELAGAEAAAACDVVAVPAPDDFVGSSALVAAYEATFGVAPGVWSPYAYDSLMLLAGAIDAAGGTDAAAVKAQLDATSDVAGWTGSITIDPATGDRDPATVVISSVAPDGVLRVNHGWSEAVGGTW